MDDMSHEIDAKWRILFGLVKGRGGLSVRKHVLETRSGLCLVFFMLGDS